MLIKKKRYSFFEKTPKNIPETENNMGMTILNFPSVLYTTSIPSDVMKIGNTDKNRKSQDNIVHGNLVKKSPFTHGMFILSMIIISFSLIHL